MEKEEIQKLIDEKINAYMNQKQYNFSRIPNHLHNGVDSQQINESSIIPAATYATFILEDTSETFELTGVPATLTSLSFSGIAYDSSSSPATKKALVFGNAIFQNCFSITGAGTTIVVDNSVGISLIQTGSSIYIDTSALTKTKVSTATGYILYVQDDTSTLVATLTISSFKQGILSITSALSANWIIQGTLTLS